LNYVIELHVISLLPSSAGHIPYPPVVNFWRIGAVSLYRTNAVLSDTQDWNGQRNGL